MSLSMQISRGALALSLLALLAVLAIASQRPAREPLSALPVTAASAVAVCELPAPPRVSAWRLAQTPADLGPLARRWESCRA